jgi:integral membrane protein
LVIFYINGAERARQCHDIVQAPDWEAVDDTEGTLACVNSRKAALLAYRAMAYITGTGLIVLVCFAVPEKYIWDNDQPVAIVGTLHGFLYMIYVVCSLVLAERYRWRPLRALLVALAGTIPFVSFYAERKVTKLVHASPPPRPRGTPAGAAPRPRG